MKLLFMCYFQINAADMVGIGHSMQMWEVSLSRSSFSHPLPPLWLSPVLLKILNAHTSTFILRVYSTLRMIYANHSFFYSSSILEPPTVAMMVGGRAKELGHGSLESRGVGSLFLIDLGLLVLSSLLICLILCDLCLLLSEFVEFES